MPINRNLSDPAALLTEARSACDVLKPVTLTGGPVNLRIRSTDRIVLDGLQQQLVPDLRPPISPGAEDIHDVAVVVNSALTQRISAYATESGELGGHRIRIARKQASGVQARESGFLIWAEDHPRRSTIVLSHPREPSGTLLLRLVRGIAIRVLLAAGWIPLHAACAMTPAGAVCLLGGHGSGKTTALLHLLSGETVRAALVANSLVFLSPQGQPEVRTLPMAIGLRSPTIKLFPALARLADSTSAAVDTSGRIYVPISTIATAFAVDRSPGGPLVACIGVTYRGLDQSRWHLKNARESEVALYAAYLSNGLADDPHEFARLADDYASGHHQRLLRIAQSIPAAAFQSGGDAKRVLALGVSWLSGQTAA